MCFTGNDLKNEYSKAVFKQIEHLKEHSIKNFYGISPVHMPVLQHQQMAINGLISVQVTNTTDTKGSWCLLTRHNISQSSLLQINKQLATAHPTFDFLSYRKEKNYETISPATKAVWICQNKDFTATPPPIQNTWLY